MFFPNGQTFSDFFKDIHPKLKKSKSNALPRNEIRPPRTGSDSILLPFGRCAITNRTMTTVFLQDKNDYPYSSLLFPPLVQ